MYQTETFPLYHPVHGECVADEATAPERLAAGWTKEKPEAKEAESDKKPEGGKGK
jgi:hypothetical protein